MQGLIVYAPSRSPFPAPDVFVMHKENVLTERTLETGEAVLGKCPKGSNA